MIAKVWYTCASVVAALTLSACSAMPSSSLVEEDGRVTLAESHIGENYDAVITRASARYDSKPHCETRKISLLRQRRAFVYDICGFNPEGQKFASAPLAEVVYHFIERELVRVDVRAEGEAALLDSVQDDMQTLFATDGGEPVLLKTDSFEWNARQQIAGVRAGAGSSAGNVHVRLLDETLKESAPWLAEE